jgi:hypothetical protein
MAVPINPIPMAPIAIMPIPPGMPEPRIIGCVADAARSCAPAVVMLAVINATAATILQYDRFMVISYVLITADSLGSYQHIICHDRRQSNPSFGGWWRASDVHPACRKSQD